MGDNASEALKIFAVIILACLVIGLAFGIYNKAASAGDVADKQIDQLTSAMDSEQYTAYVDNNISGSSVLGAITSFKSEPFCVRVDNGKQVVEYGRTGSDLTKKADGSLADAKDKSLVATTYIDPSDSYTGELIYDDNKTAEEGSTGTIIIGLQFTKNK